MNTVAVLSKLKFADKIEVEIDLDDMVLTIVRKNIEESMNAEVIDDTLEHSAGKCLDGNRR